MHAIFVRVVCVWGIVCGRTLSASFIFLIEIPFAPAAWVEFCSFWCGIDTNMRFGQRVGFTCGVTKGAARRVHSTSNTRGNRLTVFKRGLCINVDIIERAVFHYCFFYFRPRVSIIRWSPADKLAVDEITVFLEFARCTEGAVFKQAPLWEVHTRAECTAVIHFLEF